MNVLGGRHKNTTKEYEKLYEFIRRFKIENCGISPSYPEMAACMGISKSMVRVRLDFLERQGLIARYGSSSESRAIMVQDLVCVPKAKNEQQ